MDRIFNLPICKYERILIAVMLNHPKHQELKGQWDLIDKETKVIEVFKSVVEIIGWKTTFEL
jgi:hypothetical protein